MKSLPAKVVCFYHIYSKNVDMCRSCPVPFNGKFQDLASSVWVTSVMSPTAPIMHKYVATIYGFLSGQEQDTQPTHQIHASFRLSSSCLFRQGQKPETAFDHVTVVVLFGTIGAWCFQMNIDSNCSCWSRKCVEWNFANSKLIISLNSDNNLNKMTKPDKLRYGWTDKPCLNGDGRAGKASPSPF